MHSLKCLEKHSGREMPEIWKLPSSSGLDPGNGFSFPSAVCCRNFPAKKERKSGGEREEQLPVPFPGRDVYRGPGVAREHSGRITGG